MARDYATTMKKINLRETVRIYSIFTGNYDKYLQAYAKNEDLSWSYPNLHEYYESRMLIELESICGPELGSNPNDPNHPVRKLLNQRYGFVTVQ